MLLHRILCSERSDLRMNQLTLGILRQATLVAGFPAISELSMY